MRSPGIFWIASYPKSGNTWVRCLLSSLLSGADGPNFKDLGKICAGGASKNWLDDALGIPVEDMTLDEINRLRPDAYRQWASETVDPPFLKIHDRYNPVLFPADITAGTVYIAREPRDIAPSFAPFMNVSLDRAISLMGKADYTFAKPSAALSLQATQVVGSWSEHVASWLDGAKGPLLLVRYEDLLADTVGETTRLADFLGITTDAAAIGQAVAANRFEVLQAAEAAGGFREKPDHLDIFFRRGQAGAWPQDLTPEQAARVVHDHGAAMTRLGYSASSPE